MMECPICKSDIETEVDPRLIEVHGRVKAIRSFKKRNGKNTKKTFVYSNGKEIIEEQ